MKRLEVSGAVRHIYMSLGFKRLNGLVLFAERRNLVSARVPSHFKRTLPKDTRLETLRAGLGSLQEERNCWPLQDIDHTPLPPLC